MWVELSDSDFAADELLWSLANLSSESWYVFLLPVGIRGGGAIAADPGVEAEADQDHHEEEGRLLIEFVSMYHFEVEGVLLIELDDFASSHMYVMVCYCGNDASVT